jgi:hypothetical protein
MRARVPGDSSSPATPKKAIISVEHVLEIFRKSAGLASTAGCYILDIAGYTTVTSSSQTYIPS